MLINRTNLNMITTGINTAMVGMNLMTIPDPQIQEGVRRTVGEGKSATLIFEVELIKVK